MELTLYTFDTTLQNDYSYGGFPNEMSFEHHSFADEMMAVYIDGETELSRIPACYHPRCHQEDDQ